MLLWVQQARSWLPGAHSVVGGTGIHERTTWKRYVITYSARHREGGDLWCSEKLALEPFLPGEVCVLEVWCVISHWGG